MNVLIFSAHHTRPLFPMAGGLFVPFWAGATVPTDNSYIVDELIPRKPTLGYNEMSQQYYVWKHLLDTVDYVGFEHYRRIFLFDERFGIDSKEVEGSMKADDAGNWHAFVDFEAFSAIVRSRSCEGEGERAFAQAVSQYDVILPLPYTDASLEDQWRLCGQEPRMLNILETCIRASSTYQKKPFKLAFDGRRTYFCNMFVMKAPLFDDYMQLWEEVMFALQGSIDFGSRMPSFLSERLFSLYMNDKIVSDGLRFLELPFCLCENMKVAHES